MHRIDGAGHIGGMFVAEDPATSRPPTEITADWLNAVQDELAGFVESAGLPLDKADNTQIRQALTTFCRYTGYAASRTIVAATALGGEDAGKMIHLSGALSYTVTLPPLAAVPDGVVFEFFRTNAATVTVACNGAEVMWPNGGSVSSISLSDGDTLTVVKANASWYVIGGSAQLVSARGAFGASLASSGYQKLPGGLILQWGRIGNIPHATSATVTFPIAFPNACFQAVTTGHNNDSSQQTFSVSITSTSQMVIWSTSGGGVMATWFAIGH